MKTVDQLDRMEKVIVYVIGTLEELKEKGLVEGPEPLTESGRAVFAELKEQKFTPTEDEINQVMAFIMSGGLNGKKEK